MTDDEFSPRFPLNNRYVQTYMASHGVRRIMDHPMDLSSRELILTTSEGVRLQGFYSARPGPAESLVVLLHGWEGSASSAYVLSAGRYLYDRGHDIFRLNLRDHGDTHHLNQGFFWATLIGEVREALDQVLRRPDVPAVSYLAGFSLGGNFALRLALSPDNGGPSLGFRHVIGVSPLMDPAKATATIDASPVIGRYFMGKWRRSLRTKQKLFPEIYDFDDMLQLGTVLDTTRAIIGKYGEFEDEVDYFGRYTLTSEKLSRAEIPMTIITSEDDPIIPVEDFRPLYDVPGLELRILSYGGHNGFIRNVHGERYYEAVMEEIFKG